MTSTASATTDMASCRYTAFPNLHNTIHPQSPIAVSETAFQLPTGPTKESVILSWAILLRGYTNSDKIVFDVNSDEVVCVDWEHNSVEDARAHVHKEESPTKHTAVFLAKGKPQTSVQLCLQADLEASTASLISSGTVIPSHHLLHLVAQFCHILACSPTAPGCRVPPFPAESISIPWQDDPEGSPLARVTINPSPLSILNPHPVKAPGPDLLHDLIRRSHASQHDANAIEFLEADGGMTKVSYEKLHALSDGLSRRISNALARTSGKRVVPILLPQSCSLYVALLAILKAGAAFVPLNLDAPQERIRFMIDDVQAGVVITSSGFREKFDWPDSPELVIFDDDVMGSAQEWNGEQIPVPPQPILSTDPAYIMYTSGSTGKPKGVSISHLAATQSLLAHDKHIPQFLRFLQFAAPTFDVSVFDTFFPLFRGCTLVGCERGRFLTDLPQAINDLNADAAELTPTVAGELLAQRKAVPGLKVLLTIGEMLTRHVVEEFGDGLLHGMYGPTEAAIHCTMAPDFRKNAKVGDIGMPFDTVSAFVVAPQTAAQEKDVEVLPVGWVGELAIGGWQLADGYLNRPDLTQDSFVDSAMWGRLYRTGDRARIMSGRIECLGRISAGQVKIRGQRVELGEVEAVALKTPGVKTAVASVVDGSLVLYVSAPTGAVNVDAIKQVFRRWLPGFMIPSDLVVYEDLPRLPSGKADRKRLDKEYSERNFSSVGGGKLDSSEAEATIAGIVEGLLNKHPRRDDSLVAMGLDSLQAIRLVSRLRVEGLGVGVVDVMKSDTVAGIASAAVLLDPVPPPLSDAVIKRFSSVREIGLSRIPAPLRGEVADIIPCTSLQESMIAETVRDPSAYCNWILVEIPSATRLFVVEAAFRAVIMQNEILRTGFVAVNDGFAQVIWKSSRVHQFTIEGTMESNWQTSIEEMLEPPFTACLMDSYGSMELGVRIHHALYDGWSWEHILSDFQLLLAVPQLSPTRPQYREVVKWELTRSPASIESAKEFWRSNLAGAGDTKLPRLHGHCDVQSGVSVENLRLSISHSHLESSAKNVGVSPQVFVQSAWAYLLSSYAGRLDVVFGTVVSGRTLPVDGIERIIGPTILTLPIRVQVGFHKEVSVLLQEVHSFNRKLLEHTELGLKEVRKVCGSDGRFDSLVVWQQTTNEKDKPAMKIIESKDKLEFSLLIEAEPVNDEILLRATYKDEIFPAAQVSFLLHQMDCLIRGIIEDPNRSVQALVANLGVGSILSIANPHPVLVPDYSTRTLATVFEETAEEYPDAVALDMASDIRHGVAVTEKMTYSELNASANRLARDLVLRNTLSDELVAVCMEKSILCYVSILATVKAGAGYLPLTPEMPPQRIKQILRNAGVKILLSTRDVMDRIGPIEGVDMLDVHSLDVSAHDTTNLGTRNSPKTLAYAIFTSGSTGVPKGVLVEHQQAAGSLDELAQIYPAEAGDRMLQFCNIGFDMSVFEIFFAWHRGMVLCSATKGVLLRDMEAAVNALGVTHLSMTPTVAALIKPDNVPKVEFLVTTGEAVTKKVLHDWAGRGLWQAYGSSEMVNACTVNPRVRRTHDISNIGPPFENTSAFIVAADEEELVLVPRGGVGELCFGGVQVCRGYLNMEELTAKKFVVHPEFGRIYRSGDLGRLLPNNDIMFVERHDQVKIRGYRIELGEINSILLKGKRTITSSATVVARKEETPQLVSFVVPSAYQGVEFAVVEVDEVRATISALFKDLIAFVPAYMIPTAIIPVTTIPVTSHGKTDKKLLEQTFLTLDGALLEQFSKGAATGDAAGEWTEFERVVADVAEAIAHADPNTVERNTSIFKLGLDSISAIHLSNRLRSAGLRRLNVSEIMRNPTISALAHVLAQEEEAPPNGRQAGAAALKEFAGSVQMAVLKQLQYSEDQIVKILPCTPLQEATLSTKKGADPRTYYNHTILNLKADPQRLETAWKVTVKAHEILRTCFAITSHPKHIFAQAIVKEHPLPWTQHSLDSELEFATAIEQHISVASAAMDISKPPYSFGLFTSPERSVLVMSFHHSLYDGFGMDLLLEDVQRAYIGTELPARIPFDSYLQYVEGIDLAAADIFWRQLLNGLEPTSFPDLTGKSNLARKQLVGMTSQRISCSRDLDTINTGCKTLSTPLLALSQCAWARLLSVYTGELDVCFGNVVSGRTIPVDGVETITAPCFNTVPMRLKISEGATTLSIMEALQELNAEIMPFQLTPLRRIMTVLKTEGRALFDTLFLLQHVRENSLQELWDEVGDRGEMDFSIVVELVPDRNKNSLEIVIHFRRDMVLEEHIAILLQQFDSALVSTLDNAKGPALNFTGLPASLLSQANPSPATITPSGNGLLHSAFEYNAQVHQDRVALQYLEDDESLTTLTFSEVNSRANKIAHQLLSLGVVPDDAIPLHIEKSPLFYICVLAVLKAGCAFTPIDPSLPASRREFMIQELQAKIVLVAGGVEIDYKGVKTVDVSQILLTPDQPFSASNPTVPSLKPSSLAYRIYTSGSTGLPKAVSLEHRNAVQTFLASRSKIQWEPQSRLMQFAATMFDMCYYDIFMAWSYGFTLCSAAHKYLLGELQATIKRLGITILDLTPTVAGTLDASELPGVKLLYCIGEAMPQRIASDWEGKCVNSYGPTEAAMCCTITDVSSQIKAANIGKPFETTKFVVLSKGGTNILPVFGSGELCIGGSQVSREYHNNPELTKSQFINFQGGTLYRTGDVVRQLADGTFEFIGRLDDQIKIRGLRVELGEINTILKDSHKEVKDATTIAPKHATGSKEQLVSFLALEARSQYGCTPSIVQPSREDLVTTVRKAAENMLPRYMVPGVILVIDHIPLSVAGKVDKKLLEALFKEQYLESLPYGKTTNDHKDWTEDELKLRHALSEISQVPVEQIHKSLTIYELGIDSISASQVAARLKSLGIEVSVIDILERPSIELLSAGLLEKTRGVGIGEESSLIAVFQSIFLPIITAECNLEVSQLAGVFPCTAVQEGMLSQFLRSQGKLYFNHMLLKVSSDTDGEKFKAAWNSVFLKLDILRAGFVEIDDDSHSFATVTYQPQHISLPWNSVEGVTDIHNFVDKQKTDAASTAIEQLHLPPWRLVFFTAASGENYLLFLGHHALYDATSLQLIFQDVAAHYRGIETSKHSPFTMILEDIVSHKVGSQTVDDDRTFWLEQLSGSSICRLPNLCPVKIAATTYHVKELFLTWKLSDIEAACQERGLSVHAVGQTAWARVLSAYTGETALTIGVTLSGRTGLKEASGVVFPCLVTLPSLCVLTEKSNHQLALDIQTRNTQALKHQHTPLKSIQRWFEHPGESFFDSIFVYQKTEGSGKEALPWEVVEEVVSVDYTFSLEIEPTQDRLLVRATGKDSHIPAEQTELLVRQFDAALVDILQNPDGSSLDLSSIPSELLSITPAMVDEIPGDVTLLHRFVEKHKELCPDKVAFEFVTVIEGDDITKQTWTYAQLDAEGNKVANFLLDNGITTGRLVGISFEKCPQASFAILGILKAGCAYVAIDYSAPIDRKAFIIDDSNAFMVLTMDKYVSELEGSIKVPVISAESDHRIKMASTTTPTIKDLTPDNLSYCLYTSGTTGIPKGCELTHENAVQAMYAFQRLFTPHWDSESRFLQFASFHFDVSVLEQFWSWSVGICVTSAPRDLLFQDLSGAITKLKITHLDLTPSLAALLKPENVPSLCRGVFITGGEALKQDILDTWGETGVIYNGYGPTEVTIGMTMYPRVPGNGKPSNIGPQFDNVGTYIFAPGTERPVPRGAIGELCASGKLVGRGYLNRPELTQKSFPILEKYQEKIYRTGDLVRILYDGTFDFAGRADDQIKLRGQRLEIGEINEVVKNADVAVEAVATLVLKHPKQQKDQLVSFFTVRSEGSSSQSKLVVRTDKQYLVLISGLAIACRSKLPTYMVPTHFLPLSWIPLSVNNKVDNKALQALYQDTTLEVLQHLARWNETAGEWTDVEQRLRTMLAEMAKLEINEVKRSSTVFELGLDSVLVVGLARRLKRAGLAAATPSLIMQNPSLSQIASALSRAEEGGLADGELSRLESARNQIAAFAKKNSFGIMEHLELLPANIEHILPCTPLQEGMIARFLGSGAPLYFNSFSIVLRAATDVEKLRGAWNTVFQATDMLRTCFCETPDGYAQVVLKRSTMCWEELKISSEEFQHEANRSLARSVAQNKSLHSPPISILCIRTPTRCVLSINIFHALYDGNSLPLILNDVQNVYFEAFTPRPVQFADVAAHLLSTDLKAAQAFWKENIKPSSPLQLGQLRTQPGDQAPNSHSKELNLEFNALELEKICRQLQCTPQSVFQAAWASTLVGYSGPIVTLGFVVSGRSLPLDSIEGVIGPTFNTIPGSFDVGGAASWEALIKAIHMFNSASLPFHHTPLKLIHKWLRRTSEQPLFETLFVYQKDASDNVEAQKLWEICPGNAVADYPLALEVAQSSSGEITLTIVAKAEVSKGEVSEILQGVVGNLRAVLANPQSKPLNEVTYLSNYILLESLPSDTSAPKEDFPWDEQAEILKTTIAELAEVETTEIHADSSILELGLDSVEAIKLSSRLRQHGIGISVSTIMRNSTIRKMQKAIAADAVPITTAPNSSDVLAKFESLVRQNIAGLEGIAAVYPTTPMQEAMIAETLASGYTLYFNHDVLELQSWVDLAKLKAAWVAVVENSDILRTSFIGLEGLGVRHTYGQIVHASSNIHWNEIALPQDDAVTPTVDTVMKRMANEVDILGEPPVYMTVLKASESTRLVLSISHALYDAWSIGLLHEDLRQAYFGKITPRPSARLIIENIVNTDMGESKKFWEQKLDGVVPSQFPVSRAASTGPVQTHRAEIVSSTPFTEVQAFCKKVGVTVQSLGQACWALVLAHHLGETDVVFGSVLSGRDFEQADEIMFPSMNTIPVRAILHGSYKDMLSSIQENGALMLAYQHTPLREIQKLVDIGGTRLFDTIFIYQRSQRIAGKEKPLYESVGGSSDIEYNVAVEMERNGDAITWHSACKSTVLSLSGGIRLLEMVDSLLAHVVANPEHPALTYTHGGLIIGNTPVVELRAKTVLNGVRVDLDRVAAILREASADLEDCAAIIVNEEGKNVLVVFISGCGPGIFSAVVAYAKKELPYWSLPEYVVDLDQLPFEGYDADRERLHAIFNTLPDKQRYAVGSHEGAWSLLERQIRQILSKVSGIPEEEIQRTQTIFHLGLDSISAIKLSSELRKEGIFLGVADILREATIERMAAATYSMDINSPAQAPIDSTAVLARTISGLDMPKCLYGIPAEDIEAVYPVSAGQLYMLEAWKNSGRTLFMSTFTFKCSRMGLSKMQPAWESLLRQEPILRTAFRPTGDEAMPYVQVVLKKSSLQFSWFQSSQEASDDFLSFMKTQEQKKPVGVSMPPVRLCVNNTPKETILFLTIHHALYDGVSLPLLIAKLQSLLHRNPGKTRLPTPDPDGPKFVDYLALSYSQSRAKQRTFWSGYLKDAKSTLVPRKLGLIGVGGRAEFFSPAALEDAGALELRYRKQGLSLHAVLLAAFARVLHRRIILTGSSDEVIFGIYLANRNLPMPDLPVMSAPTLNIVPLRVRALNTCSLTDLARKVQKDLAALSVPENAVVNLRNIQRWTGVHVDAFFNFLKTPPQQQQRDDKDAVVLEEVMVEAEVPTTVARSPNMQVARRYEGFLHRFWSSYFGRAVKPLLSVLRFVWWFVSSARNARARITPAGKAAISSIRTNLDFEVAVKEGKVDIGAFSGAGYLSAAELKEMVAELCAVVGGK